MSTPPLIVTKWSCTFAASVAWTPAEIVPLLPGASTLPRTKVALASTKRPLRIVTGPVLKQAASAGTTTFWYVPGASTPVHVVVLGSAAAKAGRPSDNAAVTAPAASARMRFLIRRCSPLDLDGRDWPPPRK